MSLQRIGTVRVQTALRCETCGAAPEAALLNSGIHVYCWPCLSQLVDRTQPDAEGRLIPLVRQTDRPPSGRITIMPYDEFIARYGTDED